MSEKRKRKPGEAQYDRVTTSLARGYRAWLRKAADELGIDVSKLARFAYEDYIKANAHRLSDELRKELDRLRRGHGPGRFGPML